ncbi:motility associated factor glycosyltransferase family protein [Catenovulum sp. SM1970]|uniref:6-hydroxymethylpterin diphosphokinase MptE-like protein n=1 Tax=Marinifaba aquimaris TaxID=2741323 RepID=UPI0015736B40|nr:6-hydroxymethylpterin diphosphokinase MptE-like protein [Marinifaba aquimaris]NTS75369.1 motility associated factor glycosyltransferase family protein [Marinifaba aquimaris]
MLKNIRIHIEKDESKQEAIESALAEEMKETYSKNLIAFKQHIPSMVSYAKHVITNNAAIFCNKFGQHNIVDYGVGRTLYGLEPKVEIKKQLELFENKAFYIDFESSLRASENIVDVKHCQKLNELPFYINQSERTTLPDKVNTLVVLGLGLGLHISYLLEHYEIENLVIYEPELQYFQCSMMSENWQTILESAQEKRTQVFFQIEKDARDIISDIGELVEHMSIPGFYLFKHYNHPVFNSIEKALSEKNWEQLKQDGLEFNFTESAIDYLPNWTPPLYLDNYTAVDREHSDRFKSNLNTFKKYFPDIYEEFKEYKPTHWLPIINPDGEVNILKKDSLAPWYGESPKRECEISYAAFEQQPHRDGLVLGYKGKKLKDYYHYRFVNQAEQVLNDLKEDVGRLPESVKGLIVFGVGVGYQLETLSNKHEIENLFICEPNRDFFYASLYAVDWQGILEKVDELGARVYINIGDDGTNLFKDLLNQFYTIGPYVLASTYFYQTYYNSELVSAVAQLREQLQFMISMGEYFDHARYGIAHTLEMVSRGTPIMLNKPEQYLSYKITEVPVFLVGNGPSLDNSIEAIKEWSEQALIVSCGTALMPLYKNNITPDFHLEIEQNRATHDWCSRLENFEYLKQISLISVNGIHPDTANLFKDCYIALKEGESSTVSFSEVNTDKEFIQLQYAFPTVSNLAMNIFSTVGFKQIYLFGIDLGFVDTSKHHSKLSGYYLGDGKEIADYNEGHNTSIRVKGNFRELVNTKYEFKVSRSILEQTIANRKIDCFNTSDGAYISGTTPLPIDLVLLTNTPESKQEAMLQFKEACFDVVDDYSTFKDTFLDKYSLEVLKNELDVFIENASAAITSYADCEALIDNQKKLLHLSYQHGKSSLFYLFYGTSNYANSVLSKIIASSEETGSSISALETVRKAWLNLLQDIKADYLNDIEGLDFCSAYAGQRQPLYIKENHPEGSYIPYLKMAGCRELVDEYCEKINCRVGQLNHTGRLQRDSILILDQYEDKVSWKESVTCFFDKVKNNTLSENVLIGVNYPDSIIKKLKKLIPDQISVSFFWWPGGVYNEASWQAFTDGKNVWGGPLLHRHYCEFIINFSGCHEDFSWFLPRLTVVSNEADNPIVSSVTEFFSSVPCYVVFPNYIAIPKHNLICSDAILDHMGNRGRLVQGGLKRGDLILQTIDDNGISHIRNQFPNLNSLN